MGIQEVILFGILGSAFWCTAKTFISQFRPGHDGGCAGCGPAGCDTTSKPKHEPPQLKYKRVK